MRFSMIRAGVAVVAASVAFAACAGHGVVPSSSGSLPMSGGALRALAPAAPGLCGIRQVGYVFGGACNVAKLAPSGGKSFLRVYKGIAVAVKFGTNSSTGTEIIFRDAVAPGKDITGKVHGHPFPPFMGKGLKGKAFVYFEGVNTGAAFEFTQSPGITIAKTGRYPGKSCYLGELTTKGWIATPLQGKVVGKKLIFPQFPDPAGLPIPGKSAFFLAAVCY